MRVSTRPSHTRVPWPQAIVPDRLLVVVVSSGLSLPGARPLSVQEQFALGFYSQRPRDWRPRQYDLGAHTSMRAKRVRRNQQPSEYFQPWDREIGPRSYEIDTDNRPFDSLFGHTGPHTSFSRRFQPEIGDRLIELYVDDIEIQSFYLTYQHILNSKYHIERYESFRSHKISQKHQEPSSVLLFT